MTINATANLEVEIDKSEQLRITKNFLSVVFDIPQESCYIKKGKLVQWWEESMGSHSSVEEEVMRKATPQDKLYFKVMETLADLYCDED